MNRFHKYGVVMIMTLVLLTSSLVGGGAARAANDTTWKDGCLYKYNYSLRQWQVQGCWQVLSNTSADWLVAVPNRSTIRWERTLRLDVYDRDYLYIYSYPYRLQLAMARKDGAVYVRDATGHWVTEATYRAQQAAAARQQQTSSTTSTYQSMDYSAMMAMVQMQHETSMTIINNMSR